MDSAEATFNTEVSNFVFDLLEDDPIYEEFIKYDFSKIDKETYNEATHFYSEHINSEECEFLLFSVSACMVINALCKIKNENCKIYVDLTDLNCFNEYMISLIKNAKIVSEKLGVDIKKIIFYTFVIANASFSTTAEQKNKTEIKLLKKCLFKPIIKSFKNDYKQILKIKQCFSY